MINPHLPLEQQSEEKKEEENPDEKWGEKEIYDWIKKKNINIDYDIRRRTKEWALEKLKEKNYI